MDWMREVKETGILTSLIIDRYQEIVTEIQPQRNMCTAI